VRQSEIQDEVRKSLSHNFPAVDIVAMLAKFLLNLLSLTQGVLYRLCGLLFASYKAVKFIL
jgi:hypothetical protein